MNDLVYILKNGIEPDELRYSLRSVCENFEFERVWFYGGRPEGLEPDFQEDFKQKGADKWQKARSMYEAIMKNNKISSDFYLFNDDFFILGPYDQDTPRPNGTIQRQAQRIRSRIHYSSSYIQRLERAADWLGMRGYDQISYETHTPMLINRKRGLEVLEKIPSVVPFRSAYGNYYEIGGTLTPDCKVARVHEKPCAGPLMSTTDESFKDGKAGQYIRAQFPRPCQYETELK